MQHILITGSNRGIGLELVQQYLQRGNCHLFATCRQPEDARELSQLARQYPFVLDIIPLDVTRTDSMAKAMELLYSKTKVLDVLINNAAIFPRTDGDRRLGDLDPDLLLEIFDVNSIAPVMMVQACLDLLKASKNAKIVNISSQMGSMAWQTSGGNYGYCASKAALNMMTRCLAGDLGRWGIVTVTLHPGWVQTDMGGKGASLSADESVRGIIQVIDGLLLKDNGKFLRWNGTEHPW